MTKWSTNVQSKTRNLCNGASFYHGTPWWLTCTGICKVDLRDLHMVRVIQCMLLISVHCCSEEVVLLVLPTAKQHSCLCTTAHSIPEERRFDLTGRSDHAFVGPSPNVIPVNKTEPHQSLQRDICFGLRLILMMIVVSPGIYADTNRKGQ